jgi:hypothetical protein
MTVYLLGGPPRCGKTMFAERVGRRRGIGWLSTDTVRDVVDLFHPLYVAGGIGRPHGPEANVFFPAFERLVRSCAELADDYLVEGVGFYPRHVRRLAEEIDLRAVFVGMSSVDAGVMMEHEGLNRWSSRLPADQLALLPAWIESWSGELAAECAEQGLPFVDLAVDFVRGQDEAERRLFDVVRS